MQRCRGRVPSENTLDSCEIVVGKTKSKKVNLSQENKIFKDNLKHWKYFYLSDDS